LAARETAEEGGCPTDLTPILNLTKEVIGHVNGVGEEDGKEFIINAFPTFSFQLSFMKGVKYVKR
jgi:hypothetical protein